MTAVMLFTATACSLGTPKYPEGKYQYKYQWYATLTPKQIVSSLTLEQKAAQMVQPILYKVASDETSPMKTYGYGSIYGDEGQMTAAEWREMLDKYQQEAIESEAGIPYFVAQDDVHGVGYCIDAVYFPHNIGIGAANDEELTYQMGKIVADETKQCHMLWNLYPCVAQSNDPRWGRNYECYSSDLETIKKLSVSYTKGLVDGGVMATAKHYFGDGNVSYGTGEKSDFARIIDRGDAKLTQEQINELLKVYKAQIDAGVKAVMVSYSSLNGLKMHENKEYIMKLRTDMGFKGIIMTDSMAIQNTSPKTYEEQVISAVNCGIDLFMEGERYEDCRKAIVDAVNNKQIDRKRVDEAVTRIITVKKDMGLFEDPFCKNIKTLHEDVGSLESRAVAEKLVEKSLVLVKNEGSLLPFKKGTKVYVTGTTADNPRAQCGGWTMGWNMAPSKEIKGVTTIKEAFERYAKEYGIEVITDPNEAANADVVLLCVGEDAYAEWYGDSKDIKLYDPDDDYFDNGNMIDLVRRLRKPTVTCIIAGRHLIMDKLDYDKWDSVVMCYLPGSEGKGISDVLCGCSDFTGKLPEPWYESVDQIGTDKCLFERGYGLTYGNGFTPAKEPEAIMDIPSEAEARNNPMEGTDYKKGVFNKSCEYINEYAGIKIKLPAGWSSSDEEFLKMYEEQELMDCVTGKDRARAMAKRLDNYLNPGEGISFAQIEFVNTKLADPDDSDYSPDKYLDEQTAMVAKTVKRFGITAEIKKEGTVTMGGKEYSKVMVHLSGNGPEQYVAYYARKVDDKVIVVLQACNMNDFEKMVEKG